MSNQHIRNLPVPYFSQRENSYTWKERESATIKINGKDYPNPDSGNIIQNGIDKTLASSSCNTTCISMVLNYLGVTNETPTQMLEKVFDVKNSKTMEFLNRLIDSGLSVDLGNPSHNIILSNRFAPAFVETFYKDKGVSCETKWEITSNDHTVMEQEIAKGIPCIMYVGTTRPIVSLADNNALKTFLKKNTNFDTDSRINLGSGITYSTMYETLELFAIIENSKSTELQIQKTQTELDSIRKRINGLQIATKGSHFVVVRGYTDDEVIINDPWGEPGRNADGSVALTKSGLWNYYGSSIFGDSIVIKKSDFKKRYRDDGGYFAWKFHINNMWDYVYPNILPRLTKPQSTDYDFCYDTEEYLLGAFPIRKSLTWHNGIHIKGDNSQVHAIGPGSIVAARIRDKPSGADTSFNGSRCFVLMKHHIIVDDILKDFYSLYYHLKPTLDYTHEHLGNYNNVIKKNYYDWLEQIALRSFNRAVCPSNSRIAAYPYSAVSDVENNPLETIRSTKSLAMGASTVYETRETIKINNVDKEIIVFQIDGEWGRYFAQVDDFRMVFTVTEENKQIYQSKITSMENGEIAYFHDLPSNDGLLEVGSREIIGHTGWFNGYLNLVDPDLLYSEKNYDGLPPINRILHFEIFSDENIIPNFSKKGFVEIDMTNGSNKNILNGEKILNVLTSENKILNENFFEDLTDFGIISTKEFLDFYTDNFGKERLRSCVINGFNEGSDKIDWSEAYNNSKGFLKNTFGVVGTALDTVTNFANIQSLFMAQTEYIEKFRTPHIWFDDNMRQAMKSSTDVLFKQGKTTSYHPIRFLKWLIEYNWKKSNS